MHTNTTTHIRRSVAACVLIVLLAVAAVAGGRGEESPYDTYADLAELIASDTEYHLVDVRTPAEYAAGHIPGAENINVDIIASNPPTEDKDALIIVYCRSGNRSGDAKRMLEDLGYTNVHDFGGIYRWEGEVITE
jgi:phage shock protein E